ncbi:MAG: hypothetical protein HZA04_02725 [Nitrospinae bacterium]|nr:hypothetical protein [Nitrospinota bacterium]
MSTLNMMGWDVAKPAADIGIDIIALNHTEMVCVPKPELTIPQQLYFQVKSRRIADSDWKGCDTSGGHRSTVGKEFILKRADYDLLLRTPRSFLVCYFVEVSGDGYQPGIPDYFWLSREHLCLLDGAGFVWKKDSQVRLRTEYKTAGDIKDELIDVLKEVPQAIKENILKLVNKSAVKNNNTHSFVRLARPNRSGQYFPGKDNNSEAIGGEERLVWRMLPEPLLDLRNILQNVSLEEFK